MTRLGEPLTDPPGAPRAPRVGAGVAAMNAAVSTHVSASSAIRDSTSDSLAATSTSISATLERRPGTAFLVASVPGEVVVAASAASAATSSARFSLMPNSDNFSLRICTSVAAAAAAEDSARIIRASSSDLSSSAIVPCAATGIPMASRVDILS